MNHIGASETPAIMGHSPFMTRFQLMKRKLGMETFKPNRATEHGKRLEPVVRQIMELRLKEPLPEVVLQSKEHLFMVAQIDGFGVTKQVEIKCPFSETSFNDMVNRIPYHYQLQMQHQMLVSGRKACVFVVYFEGSVISRPYESNPDLQTDILDSCRIFVEDLKQARQGSGI